MNCYLTRRQPRSSLKYLKCDKIFFSKTAHLTYMVFLLNQQRKNIFNGFFSINYYMAPNFKIPEKCLVEAFCEKLFIFEY